MVARTIPTYLFHNSAVMVSHLLDREECLGVLEFFHLEFCANKWEIRLFVNVIDLSTISTKFKMSVPLSNVSCDVIGEVPKKYRYHSSGTIKHSPMHQHSCMVMFISGSVCWQSPIVRTSPCDIVQKVRGSVCRGASTSRFFFFFNLFEVCVKLV